MNLESPLRYPGGKRALAGTIAETMTANGLVGAQYFEPFAGGGAVGLHLLGRGIASEIHLNDIDPSIHCFWQAITQETEQFAQWVMTVPINLTEWKHQQEIYRRADLDKPFELGFAAFYLNRCNHSGIISGSTPIGGYAQRGKWTMDIRFYRETLARRVRNIGEARDHIHIYNMDAIEFIQSGMPPGSEPTFLYLDPPYQSNGSRLYARYYESDNHRQLAVYLARRPDLCWAMSYDDTPRIRELYPERSVSNIYLGYSLHRKRMSRELLIFSLSTTDPRR